MKKLTLFLLLSIISVFLVTSCTDMHTHHKAKYVFLFIGDGMGQAQVNLAEAYQATMDNKKGFEHFGFTEFPAVGFASTYAFNNFITGSAASGTALATGHKTNINRISMDPEGKQPFKTIAEKFKESGMKVGILTSVSIDHATPAVFYAHQPKRSMYFEIGNDLVNSSFDFFGGGGFKLPEGEIDGQSINLIEKAKENGFGYVNNVDDFLALNKEAGRVIAVPNPVTESGAMNYVIDMGQTEVHLGDLTAKAIEMLDNENGFFMMVEGGKIDWACHSDDAATVVHEVIDFAQAIDVAIAFYDKHPDETLIVVTADHETGGLTLGTGPTKYDTYFNLLQYQKMSEEKFTELIGEFRQNLSGNADTDFEKMMEVIGENFGLGNEEKIPLDDKDTKLLKDAFNASMYPSEGEDVDLTYGKYEPLATVVIKMMSDKAAVGWTTHAHTGVNVPVYALGIGAEYFSSYIDNTDIPKFIEEIVIEGVH